ncbi:Lon protease [Tetrabaena socialis]|uniref:Lon protease n=1 Tax=Tetrabaena socialis TaxID=47790 RepID=A0A2J7ZQN5_9CHLO|nr:Lon protease [Tetrabaena socialis]|eukprot:PNH02588.1 Lon protease [Tetrabaena socialis]
MRPDSRKRVHPAVEEYGQAEIDFFRSQTRCVRRRILATEDKVAEYNDESIPVRFKVILSDMSDHVKAIAVRRLQHLANTDDRGGEYLKVVNWVETMCRLPIGKYCSLPVTIQSPADEIAGFVKSISNRLDAAVYGHTECKDHILRILGQWIINPVAKGMVIGIQGAAGVGKTSLVKEGICAALGMPFAFIPLGGASDGSFLEGHSYTYEGAIPGKMVDVIIRAKCMNPVLFFDETDKISTSSRGQEITNILIHLTDSSQNDSFSDRYFSDIAFDFSRSLMIFSFNDASCISPILLDRMTIINANGYNAADKLKIATRHLIPEILKEFSMEPDSVIFGDGLLRHIIEATQGEEGVRNLKRSLHKIISNVNLQRIMNAKPLPCVMTKEEVDKFMGPAKVPCMMHSAMYV